MDHHSEFDKYGLFLKYLNSVALCCNQLGAASPSIKLYNIESIKLLLHKWINRHEWECQVSRINSKECSLKHKYLAQEEKGSTVFMPAGQKQSVGAWKGAVSNLPWTSKQQVKKLEYKMQYKMSTRKRYSLLLIDTWAYLGSHEQLPLLGCPREQWLHDSTSLATSHLQLTHSELISWSHFLLLVLVNTG